MKSTVIAIDIAKNVFQVAVSKTPGKVCEEHRLSRGKVFEWLARREESVVVMEACGSAHHLGRKCLEYGHEAVLLPPDRLGPISKRVNRYLREMLIHGARSALNRAKARSEDDRTHLETWAVRLDARKGYNKAVVALANRIARAVWAVWTQRRMWQPDCPPATAA
ncbi:MAG: transposase [Acidobacteria bacterium]|nr:MAG: transposase [Acidobacteriota bacterium]REK09274.1 MAG: transposase [Acidobacteriota bacterium]